MPTPPRKRIVRKKSSQPRKPKAQWNRPSKIEIEVLFAEGNRKVTPADLVKAAEAAAVAARTSLEARTPRYMIGEIEVMVDYTYVQSRKRFKA